MMKACAFIYKDALWSQSVTTAGAFMSKWAWGAIGRTKGPWKQDRLGGRGSVFWEIMKPPCHVLWSLLLHGLKWSHE